MADACNSHVKSLALGGRLVLAVSSQQEGYKPEDHSKFLTAHKHVLSEGEHDDIFNSDDFIVKDDKDHGKGIVTYKANSKGRYISNDVLDNAIKKIDAEADGKIGVYFIVDATKSDVLWIPALLQKDFQIQNAFGTELNTPFTNVIILKKEMSKENVKMRPPAFTTIVVAAVVYNSENKKIMVVKEEASTEHFKLPGGSLMPGENFEDGTKRILETFGVNDPSFHSVLEIKHGPHKGNSMLSKVEHSHVTGEDGEILEKIKIDSNKGAIEAFEGFKEKWHFMKESQDQNASLKLIETDEKDSRDITYLFYRTSKAHQEEKLETTHPNDASQNSTENSNSSRKNEQDVLNNSTEENEDSLLDPKVEKQPMEENSVLADSSMDNKLRDNMLETSGMDHIDFEPRNLPDDSPDSVLPQNSNEISHVQEMGHLAGNHQELPDITKTHQNETNSHQEPHNLTENFPEHKNSTGNQLEPSGLLHTNNLSKELKHDHSVDLVKHSPESLPNFISESITKENLQSNLVPHNTANAKTLEQQTQINNSIVGDPAKTAAPLDAATKKRLKKKAQKERAKERKRNGITAKVLKETKQISEAAKPSKKTKNEMSKERGRER
uniref:Nudix hydrolase domain-containing protein n=1 Tax=Ditylenchus dipsaci TaxID=166011 RepID=A0A915EC53_9BILA